MNRLARSFGCLLLVAATLVSFWPAAGARAEAGQAFSISPPLIELRADPGQSVTAKIKLTNLSGGELLMKSQFNDFGAKNETGEPNIIFDDNQNTPYSLRQWITSPTPFKLSAGETKTIDFPISVPTDAEPGGHYAVIRFSGSAPDIEQNGVSLTASVGSLVLLRVSGSAQEKAALADFYSATPKFAKTAFFESGPISFVERLNNEGNVHLKPTGTIDIFNMFGQKVTSLRVNGDPNDNKDPSKSILPKSIRRFEQTWQSGWQFGKFEAKLNLSYGQNNTPLTTNVTFWVIPYTLIASVAVAGAALFFLLRWAVKRYNAHIIAKARS